MRKVLTFLSACLCLSLVVSARGQQPPDKFPDVPPDHWAYQAVESLRAKGILVGYPDGLYRGKRTITRYEFAVALDRALKTLPTTGPQGPKGPPGDRGERGPQGERGAQGPTGIGPEELATLRRLANEFRDELASLGRTMADVNRRLDNAARELAAIKAQIARMPKVYGGTFVGLRSDNVDGGYVDKDGRVNPLGSTQAVVHLVELGIMADIAGGGVLDAALQTDNYRNYLGGNFAFIDPAGLRTLTAPSITSKTSQDVRIDRLNLTTPFASLGRGSKLTIGRFAKQLGHLTLWKPDIDTYFDVPFVDDGKYRMDGANLTTRFGSLEFDVFGAQFNSVQGSSDPNGALFVNSPLAGTVSGETLFRNGMKPFGQVYEQGHLTFPDPGPTYGPANPPLPAPAINPARPQYDPPDLGQDQNMINQILGVSFGIGIRQLQGGHIRLTAMDTNVRQTGSTVFTGVHILGSDLSLKLMDRLTLMADWGKTIPHTGHFTYIPPDPNTGKRNLHQNNAFNANLTYSSGGLNVGAGYRYIDPNFYAPGYWGRIGNWLNPTNIQGPSVRASYNLASNLGVNVGGDFYSAARAREDVGGLGRDDEITRVLVGVRWSLTKGFDITADWEGVYWKLQGAHFASIPVGNPATTPQPGIPGLGATAIHPTEHYVTIGTGYNLTSNTRIKLAYQLGSFDGKGVVNQGPAGTRFNFGAFTAQAAVRF